MPNFLDLPGDIEAGKREVADSKGTLAYSLFASGDYFHAIDEYLEMGLMNAVYYLGHLRRAINFSDYRKSDKDSRVQ